MKIFNVAAWAGLAISVLALDPVEVKGNALFVKGSDKRFYIRGLDYQPGGSSDLNDPLADPKTCERDIKYFKELGINTIRVYSVDNTADHDECMEQLADAGIYLILDVNTPDASISRADPKCSYNTLYLEQVLATVKMMSAYNNTLGFFAGNEVINDETTTSAAPYVKAVVRDMKQYIHNQKLRAIPVGYSAADVSENRLQTAQYFNCGDDPMARSDWFGFNDYSWCGRSSFTTSGYDQKVKAYSNYSIPLFLSEFGCNKPEHRPFTEVEAIYSTKMSSVFSGGLVYEYSEEKNEYGLVEIDGDTVTPTQDFANLKAEYGKTSDPSGDGGYQLDLAHSECPEVDSDWNATSTLPPTPKGAYKYINGTAEPQGKGLNATTQWACVDKGNNVDDSSSHSMSASSSASGSKSSSTSSGSKSSSSSSSSSTKKSDGTSLKVQSLSWVNAVSLAGVIAGFALI